jgi:uncharacterized 2Fe-2S/4Fe-4S cluster protein (DUF4445 family)
MNKIELKLYDGSKRIIKIRKGETILSCLQENNIPINAICGGLGKCGKCKIKIIDGKNKTSSLSQNEEKILTKEDIKNFLRLACQSEVKNDLNIEIPYSSMPINTKITTYGFEPKVKLIPPVKKVYVEIDINDFKALNNNKNKIFEKLNALNLEDLSFHNTVKDKLLPMFDVSNGKLTVTIRDNEIIDLEKGDTSSKLFGFALDIGTTQLSLFIVDLIKGDTIDFISELNEQNSFGADVISRLSYIIKNRGNLEKINKVNVSQINRLIKNITERNLIDLKYLYEGVAVGNTLMMHILHSVDPSSLGSYPYIPKILNSMYKRSSSYNVNINYLGKIYTPPNIAGYMGSDIISDIISSGIHERKVNSLLIDIGTNTEIVLFYDGEFYGSSTPSGPAFEGGQIRFGMRAESGAIDAVFIDPTNHDLKFTTINNYEPIGICGSGIIDSLSEFYKNNIIDNSGKILTNSKLITQHEGIKAVRIFDKNEENKIFLTQADIREVQKAKAAIQAGYLSLLRYTNVNLKDLERVIIAGSFGVHINLDSGRMIGVIPPVDESNIDYLGNLAGAGARILLKSSHLRAKSKEISENIKYIELGNLDYFQKLWLKSLNIHSENK